VNTYFVHLEEQVGPAAVVATAKRMGISFAAPADARMAATSADTWGSFTLGVIDTTPLELAEAYATVAAGGVHCSALPVSSVKDSKGAAVAVGRPDCSQVLDPDVAHAAADAARCPVGQQSTYGKCNGGTAPQIGAMFGSVQVAGKTGSTEDNQTETFVGFTTSMVAAGTAANPDDPTDHVGSAVESQVVTAVGRTLLAAVGPAAPDFTAPSSRIALGQ
jgi:membrane peptidoglycan carboxypeptidase